jgi:ferredoxin
MNGVEARGEVVAFLRRALVGPDPQPEHLAMHGGEEILRPQDPPRLRYSAGVLFPVKDAVMDADNATAEEVEQASSGPAEGEEPEEVGPTHGGGGDADANTEQEVNRANEFLPSAMGLTAVVRLPKEFRVTVRCARYEKKAMPGLGRADKEGRWQPHYWRHPINDTLLIDGSQFVGKGPVIGTPKLWVKTGDENLKLQFHVFSRPFPGAEHADTDRIVTFTLINRTESPGGAKDVHCAFQCEFTVEDAAGGACFLAYPEADLSDQDVEDQALKLLYRDCRTFAIGHGCSARWSEPQSGAAPSIATDVLPEFEVKPIVPATIPGLTLSMRDMAKDELWQSTVANCRRLASEYLVWIDNQESALATAELTAVQHQAGSRHLANCRQCHSRIVSGIEVLDSDQDAARAFRWMNTAMLHQQLHYNLATDHRRGWDAGQGTLRPSEPYVRPDYENLPPNKGTWRPFQLAFILMNIGAIVDQDDDHRDTVDLIWFPTGGGKTEAYLGLTAFTILHRRLLNPLDSGTTVLMRYTLRLLTTWRF